jgi:hypothetical protein
VVPTGELGPRVHLGAQGVVAALLPAGRNDSVVIVEQTLVGRRRRLDQHIVFVLKHAHTFLLVERYCLLLDTKVIIKWNIAFLKVYFHTKSVFSHFLKRDLLFLGLRILVSFFRRFSRLFLVCLATGFSLFSVCVWSNLVYF